MICPSCQYSRTPEDSAPEHSCPQCGIVYAKYDPNKKRPIARPKITDKEMFELKAKVLLFGVLIAIIGYAAFVMSEGKKSRPVTAREPIKAVSNSPYDGSVRQVEKFLKATLKDPDSLQVIEWSPVVERPGGGFSVRCKYRAKNSFGGYVVENRIFVMDSMGTVLGSEEM